MTADTTPRVVRILRSLSLRKTEPPPPSPSPSSSSDDGTAPMVRRVPAPGDSPR